MSARLGALLDATIAYGCDCERCRNVRAIIERRLGKRA